MRGHLNLGNILVKINKSEEAEKSYRRATILLEESAKISDQISPLHITALLRLAELISKDPQKAKEAFQIHERILTLKSDYRPAFESWTQVMRASNRNQEAAVMLAKALEYESSDPDVLYNVSHFNRLTFKSSPFHLFLFSNFSHLPSFQFLLWFKNFQSNSFQKIFIFL